MLEPAGGSVVDGCEKPDYAAAEIPSKPPTEFDHVERRAALLQQVRDLGHPDMIHQGEAAERYGVSQQQISKDLDRIGEYVGDTLGERHALTVDSVFRRSIQGLLEEGEYRKAARTVKEYDEWVAERTDLQDIREELEFLREAHEVQE